MGKQVVDGDSLWNNVSLLMHFDGVQNGISFPDVKGHTVTRVGTPVTDVAATRIGTAVGKFNGTTDSLTVTPISTEFNFGIGDFCIEWNQVTLSLAAIQTILARMSSSSSWAGIQWYLVLDAAGAFTFVSSYGGGSSNFFSTPNNTAKTNVRQNFCIERFNGVWYFYVDGIRVTLSSGSGYTNSMELNSNSQPLQIAGFAGWGARLAGSIDELRITKSHRYGANFTPSATAFPEQV